MQTGTITLKSPSERAAILAPIKAPVKKTNIIEVVAYLDGEIHPMSFSVPMSSVLMSGQKTKAGISEIITAMITSKFGRVVKL